MCNETRLTENCEQRINRLFIYNGVQPALFIGAGGNGIAQQIKLFLDFVYWNVFASKHHPQAMLA